MFSRSKLWTRIRQTSELVADRIQQQLRSDRRKNIRRSLAMPAATEILEDRTLLASFTVNTLVDENDGIGTGGVSLRDAIAAASNGDDISFSVQGTINLTNGELLIDKALSIDGEMNNIVIDAGGNSRVFNIDNGSNNTIGVLVSLSNLTITGGSASGNANGGGIFNSENLTISNSTISQNTANSGGGIYNRATARLIGSTVNGNMARFDGGGITSESVSSQAFLEIVNSTISGNSSNGVGGGIALGGSVVITNATITGNTADFDNNGTANPGGGIANILSFVNQSQVVNNSIVAGNFAGSSGNATPNDIDAAPGFITSASNNLIGDASSAGAIMDGQDGNIVGNNGTGTIDINTVLSTTLADNGGPTQTHALVAGSPAINAGDNALAVDAMSNPLTTDQRGTGFPRVLGAAVDIGAVEAVTSPSATITDPLGTTESGIIVIGFDAVDPLNSLLTATFEYSIDGGATFALATPTSGSNPTSPMSFGSGNTFVWDSVADGVGNESIIFRLTVDNGTDQAFATTSFTVDNPVLPSLSIDDVTIAEGDSSNTAVTFTVSLSQAANQDVQFDFVAVDGTALQSGNGDDDYLNAGGTETITQGQTQATITIFVNGDEKVELDETFTVMLSNAMGATIADDTGVGTITNDDAATISIDDVTADEGDSGTTPFAFTVTLDAEVDTGVSFIFGVSDNTANGVDGDYTHLGLTTRNFSSVTAGSTETITVQVNGDTKIEADEVFVVVLGSVSAGGRNVTFSDRRGVGTITNDDVANLSINDVTLNEGDSGNTEFEFTVSLDRPALTDVTFNFSLADGTASIVTDTVGIGPANQITAGQTSATATVFVSGDTTVELDETFFVDLLLVQGANLADGRGLGTITNDDAATLSIDDVTVIERNNGTSQAVFTVTLDNAVDAPFTVDFDTNDGTATVADNDYIAVNGTLNFAGNAGETQTISVDIIGDNTFEADETFSVNLSNLQAGGRNVTFAVSTGDGTIQNDDLAPNQATFTSNAIPVANISGGLTTLVSGNFDGTPVDAADDIFFWDPVSGNNRILFGDANRTQQDNPIDTTLINGNDFTEVFVGDFDGGGNTDLFFWNPATGRNRLIHINGGTGGAMSTFQTNVIDPTQINGNDFTTAVVADLDGIDQADLFFWNPTSGRNRIAHFITVTAGTDSAVSSVQTNVIDPTQINGGDFQSVDVGQFESGGLDELLFTNLTSGKNRRVSFNASGGSTAFDMVRDGNASLLNGSAYDTIEVADLNGDGLDDVFAWNPNTGENRSLVTDIDPAADPTFVDNAFATAGVNGDYDQVVRLIEDVFTNTPQDDLFFWNPTTGANRIGSL